MACQQKCVHVGISGVMDTLLRRGGFTSLPAKFVLKAMKSNQNNNMLFGLNTFQNRIWYCFDYDNREYDAPLAQTKILNSLSDACIKG